MKFLNILLVLVILNFGCKNSEKETQPIKKETNNSKPINKEKVKVGNTSTQNELGSRPNDSIVELYAGLWINNDFLTQVENKKSIYKSIKYQGTLFGFSLDLNELKNGKTNIYGFSEHEGGPISSIKWDDQANNFKSKGFTNYNTNIQTPMNLVITKKNLVEFEFEDSHSETYRKVTDEYTELRKILFKSDYKDESGKIYQFKANGELLGFDEKKYYTLLYDFMEEINLDVIFISDNKKRENEKMYHYKFTNDKTLKIYEINGEVPELQIGKLRYVLSEI